MRIYVTYDSKGETYENLHLFKAKGDAIRAFTNAVNKQEPNNVYYTNPEDFTLFEMGEYDMEKGEIKLHKEKQCLGCLMEYKKLVEKYNEK